MSSLFSSVNTTDSRTAPFAWCILCELPNLSLAKNLFEPVQVYRNPFGDLVTSIRDLDISINVMLPINLFQVEVSGL
jgi:hypothetical protein